MAHYLYRPHVSGPRNSITTPDIVIDRACLLANGERGYVPVHRLNSSVELQVFPRKLEITPAYAIVAAGGGALLSLAALVRDSGEPAAKADILVARTAWRLRNLIEHFGSLQLGVGVPVKTGSVVLSRLAQPADFMIRADGGELALPRGVIALCAAPPATLIAAAPAAITVGLSDATLGRELSHTVDLVSVDTDRWNERPLPRYTVGPVGPVEHYI